MAASRFGDKVINWMVTRADEEQAKLLPGNGDWDLAVAKLVEHQKKNVGQGAKENASLYVSKFGKGANHIIACYKFRRKHLVATTYLERNVVFGLYSQFVRMHLTGKLKAVEADGVATQKKKVEAITLREAPQSPKELKGFLGTVNFYRKFIPDYAQKAIPLTNLLRKNVKFCWDKEQEIAFQQPKFHFLPLRRPLLDRPVTNLPQFEHHDHK